MASYQTQVLAAAMAQRAQLEALAVAKANIFTGANTVIGAVFPPQAKDMAEQLEKEVRALVPNANVVFKEVSAGSSGACIPVVRCGIDRVSDKSKVEHHIELVKKYPDQVVVLMDVDVSVDKEFASKLGDVVKAALAGAPLIAQLGLNSKADALFIATKASEQALQLLQSLRKQTANKWLTHVLSEMPGLSIKLMDLARPKDDGAGLPPIAVSVAAASDPPPLPAAAPEPSALPASGQKPAVAESSQ